METLLEEIRSTLKSGLRVQVSTYLRSNIYGQKHADWFFLTKDGNLAVKSGKSSVRLSVAHRPCVSIRFEKAVA